MLVERTIHQGLRVLGDIYGVNADLSGQLLVALTTWLKDDTTIGIPAVGTTTLTVYGLITVPAGPGYTTGLLVERDVYIDGECDITGDVEIGGYAQIQGKASVGDDIHADYTFYVDENAVNGKLALFKTFFAGPAVVDIDSRPVEDSQLRFLEGGVFQYSIGSDATPGAFVISATEGVFSTATDILRLSSSSNQYLYSSSSVIFNLVARTLQSTLVLQLLIHH